MSRTGSAPRRSTRRSRRRPRRRPRRCSLTRRLSVVPQDDEDSSEEICSWSFPISSVVPRDDDSEHSEEIQRSPLSPLRECRLTRCIPLICFPTVSARPVATDTASYSDSVAPASTSISPNHVLVGAGALVALISLDTLTRRASIGTASYSNALDLARDVYTQQAVDSINHGESPITGAGRVFHVENPATVSYLEAVGRTGYIVPIRVSPHPFYIPTLSLTDRYVKSFFLPGIPCLLCQTLTIITAVFLAARREWWGLGILVILILSRLIVIDIVRRRRGVVGEPMEEGRMLIHLNQDRWIELHGPENDLWDVVTLPQLRDESALETTVVSAAKLSIVIATAFAGNISTVGSLMLISLFLLSFVLSASSNLFLPTCLPVFDRVVHVDGEPERVEPRMRYMESMFEQSGENGRAIATVRGPVLLLRE